jgi:hypothetical protein
MPLKTTARAIAVHQIVRTERRNLLFRRPAKFHLFAHTGA